MNKTLILDGAVGTELIKRGLKLPLPLWSASANISHPEIITEILNPRQEIVVMKSVLSKDKFQSRINANPE